MGDEVSRDTMKGYGCEGLPRAHMKIPPRVCQSFTSATEEEAFSGCLRPGAMSCSARTGIFFDDGEILEIYHLDKQATETEVWV